MKVNFRGSCGVYEQQILQDLQICKICQICIKYIESKCKDICNFVDWQKKIRQHPQLENPRMNRTHFPSSEKSHCCATSVIFLKHLRWNKALKADSDPCVGQEALSVVSEDQSIFEPPYPTAPTMHIKAEMTSSGGFSHPSKQSPEPTEPEWVGSVPQNPGKRGEHVNGTRWVRMGRGHRGAQVPGQSDRGFVTAELNTVGFSQRNVCCSLTKL